jgi:hypothetical protein
VAQLREDALGDDVADLPVVELLAQERAEADRNTEGADRRGLIIQWSEYPTWIELRDLATGEWYEVKPESACPAW